MYNDVRMWHLCGLHQRLMHVPYVAGEIFGSVIDAFPLFLSNSHLKIEVNVFTAFSFTSPSDQCLLADSLPRPLILSPALHRTVRSLLANSICAKNHVAIVIFSLALILLQQFNWKMVFYPRFTNGFQFPSSFISHPI